MGKSIKIPGRFESAETGNIVAGADAIKDDVRGKTQYVVNNELEAAILQLGESKQNKLTFEQTPTEDSPNPVTSGGVYAADQALSAAIEAILLLIPSAASALNQLADKNFVNSSIATNTATFMGTYNLVSDLHLGVSATHEQIEAALDALSLGADNNDYAFVQIPNTDTAPTEIVKTERYKYNGTGWFYEYDLNNSGFTSDQWAAINSGITTLLVSKLSALPTSAALASALAGKQDNLTFDYVPTAGSQNPVTSGGVYARNNEIVALINALDAEKQDVLTFDTTPTNGSTNPVTSNGIYLAISLVQSAVVGLDGRMGTVENNIVNLQAAYAALTQSDIVVVEGALPTTGQQINTIYRQPDPDHTPPQFYSDYMWNGTAWVLMATYDNAIDPRPKKASQNLVTSGGVFDNIGALDVSELNATENPHTLAKYVDLSAALAAIPTDYQKGGMSIKFVQSSDNMYVQYRLMAKSFTTNEADWQGVDGEPTAESANLVTSGGVEYAKKDSLVGLNAEVYGNKVRLIGDGIRGGYIDADGIFHENNSYVLFNISTCRGMHITMTEGTSTQYAFLKDYNSERVSFVSGGGRVSGTLNNTEIPSDALYLYMYTGAYSTAVVPTLEISESTYPGILSLLNQKRVITGNIYKSHTQISSISDVLSSIPTYIRLGNSILVFRDKDYQIHVFVFKSEIPSDTNWNNVSLWVELAYKDDIEGLEQDVYNIIDNSNVSPLVFNKVSESVAVLDNDIVLSQDGDSIELSVKTNCPYVDGSPNTPAGYGFALSNEEHGIGIGLSSNRIAVRADDSTWILRGGSTEPYYNPGKNTYILKISYESGNILTYVDDTLVNTYSGQKTITIKGFGNGANLTYGYWDGIIYWLKVNGKLYNIPYLSSMSNVEKVEYIYPDMLFEKTANSINVYRKLDGDEYIKYPILKAYKGYTEGEYPSFYDNWGLRQVSKCKFDGISTITNVEALFRDGEAECAIAVQRGANYGTSQYPYVGGSTHGFDNIKITDNKRHFIIMVDNSSIGESDIVQLKAVKNVQIKQESSLYQAYTNSNPWGDVIKKWTFDESGVFIETKIKWLRDILVYKCQQGMMCVYRHWLGNSANDYLTNNATKDNEFVVYNVEDGWESEPVNAPLKNVDNGCNKITEWGQKGLGFSLEIIDDNRAQSGGMDVGTNDSSYNKIYFSTINNTEVAIISSGTIHYATQKWEIYKN